MLFGRKKEREVEGLIDEHLAKVEECLTLVQETIKIYLEGKIEEAKNLSYKTHLTESEADKKRREIIHLLYEGAFLPTYREGLMEFAKTMDKIADHSESSCDFLLCQRPDVPEEYKENVLKITEDSIACFKPLKEAVFNLFKDFSVLREKTAEVDKLEAEVDKDEWRLTHEIFMSKLSLAQKIHLGELIWHISEISDVCQDAADCIEAIVVKKSF